MKAQDIIFIIVLLFLLYQRNPRLLVFVGLTCLIISIPLFQLWIFFTAERLVFYAAAFFFVAIVLSFLNRFIK